MLKKITLFVLSAVIVSTHLHADSLVVYSGRGEALVGELLDQFEADTGIKVSVRYNSTAALATQLLSEGAESAADVIFLQDPGYLGVLAKAGVLQPLAENVLDPVDPRFRDDAGYWVGTSARARVLVYNPDAVAGDELPNSLRDLADPKWAGRMGWAPSNASAQAHMTALRHLWGEADTEKWLAAVKANKPISYQKNAPQVTAAGNGEIDIAWTNHYYYYRLKEQNPKLNVAIHHFPAEQDAGNLLMVAGVGIRTGANNQVAAEALIAYLIGEDAQTYFAQHGFEYPTRTGIATAQGMTPIAELNLADTQQQMLADVTKTLSLLRALGLQ